MNIGDHIHCLAEYAQSCKQDNGIKKDQNWLQAELAMAVEASRDFIEK